MKSLCLILLLLSCLPCLVSCEDDRQLHEAKEAVGTYEFVVWGDDSPDLPKPAFTLKADGSVEFHDVTIQEAFAYYFTFDEEGFAALSPDLTMDGLRGKWRLSLASKPPEHQIWSGYHSLSLLIELDSVKKPELRAFFEKKRISEPKGYCSLGCGLVMYGDEGFLKKDPKKILLLPYLDPDDALLEHFVMKK